MTFSRNELNVDVMDRAGRARRIALAVAVGIAVAVATYFISYAIVQPDTIGRVHIYVPGRHSFQYNQAWKFIYFATAFFGGLATLATAMIAKRAAKR